MFFSDFWINIVKIMRPRVALGLTCLTCSSLPGSLAVSSPDFTGVIQSFVFDSSLYTTVTPYLGAGIFSPNKNDYRGAAFDIEIWSNDSSEQSSIPDGCSKA